MLALAAREATSIGFLMGGYSDVEIDDPSLRMAAPIEQKLAWVRQAAGERFADLKLSLMLTVMITVLVTEGKIHARAICSFSPSHIHWRSNSPHRDRLSATVDGPHL